MGLLGIMLLVHNMQEKYGVTKGGLKVYHNGKLALEWAALEQTVSITEPHSDLITAQPLETN